VIGFIPGLNSVLVFNDPKATTFDKTLAVGTDVLAVVGVGAVVKLGAKGVGLAKGVVLGAEVAEDGGLLLYHGTSVKSALGFLNGEALEATAAAAAKIDGPPGFFLATHSEDAMYFALRRQGTVLEYKFSAHAIQKLGGMQAPPLGALGKFGRFMGGEVVVTNDAFGLFNSLREAGHITVAPFHF
jgi:hypothetical protein